MAAANGWKQIGVITALIGLALALQAAVVVPVMRDSLRPDIVEAVRERGVHQDAVTRVEMRLILDRLDRIEGKLDRLSR